MNTILQVQREYRGGESIFEANKKGGKGFRISGEFNSMPVIWKTK